MQRRNVMLLALLVGCGHSERSETPASESWEERGELARDQSEERNELAGEQRDERADLSEEAREDSADLNADAAEETRRLETLVAEACEGVSELDRSTCPLDQARVESMRRMENGVSLGMKRTAGSAEAVETRVNCYRAGVTLRADAAANAGAANRAPTPGQVSCLVDYPDVEIGISETGGRVFVELTAAEQGGVVILQDRARELTSRVGR
jgi:hypothetical protein